MAKVKYKPEPGGSDETSQFGYDFKGGKAVEVDDPLHLAKFRGNRFFEVSETKAEAKKVDEAIERATPTPDIAAGVRSRSCRAPKRSAKACPRKKRTNSTS
jgi:hypothetical protein